MEAMFVDAEPYGVNNERAENHERLAYGHPTQLPLLSCLSHLNEEVRVKKEARSIG